MRFSRKIAPEIKPRQNFITKKRLREDEINFDKLRSYRLDRVKKELEKNNLEACILFDPVNIRYALDTLNIFCISADPNTVSFISGSKSPDKDFSTYSKAS